MTDERRTRVRQVMTPSPKMIDGLATVREAMEAMRRDGISSLVIDRRREGDEYGMVVVTDIADKVIAPDRPPDRTSVYEVMSKPVLTVDVDMDIKYAIRLLSRLGLSRALVTEGGRLAGIVTQRDMVLRYIPPPDEDR